MPKDFQKDLPSLLGQGVDDPEVLSFLKKLDPAQKVRLNSLKEPRWASEAAGVEIHGAPKTKRIHTIFLYAEGYEDNHQYAAELPHGLDFSMQMAQVKACFPRPPDFHSPEHATWDFDTYRIIVMFDDAGKAITNVNLTSNF